MHPPINPKIVTLDVWMDEWMDGRQSDAMRGRRKASSPFRSHLHINPKLVTMDGMDLGPFKDSLGYSLGYSLG